MTNNSNPWAGLASYEDPSKSERKLKFCGRDNDIYDVTRLIDDNLLLILYGKSGIGKTSLLNAGVFPKLRLEQYLPVSIRLGTLEANASYQESVISAIEKAIKEVYGSITVYDVVEEQTDNQQSERLWNYFARHRFANTEKQPLFPVVVLDQFEEVLRNISFEHVGKAHTLLNQLQYLIDESHALSDCIVDGKDYFYDFNFRFVISIREDELYLLEDNIDDLSLSMFRNCRYRLRSLSEQGAKEAILVPGKDCISDEEKQAVVDRVIELSKRPQSNEIDTLLLSLVCAGTFDKKTGNNITLSDLAVWKNNPMDVYYQDAIKGLSANQVRYIQQHLIREDGSRRRLDAKEVKAALGESTYQSLTRGENRMLVLGEHNHVELLHDQLALAVYEERKAFEERERKKKLRRRVLVIGWFIFIIFGAFWWQNKNIKEQNLLIFEINQDIRQKNYKLLNDSIILAAQMDSINKRDMLIVLQQDSLEITNNNLESTNAQLTIERNNLKATNWKMMENQSRFVAEKAKNIAEENSYLARILAVEVLPKNLSHADRPYTPEAEAALRESYCHNYVVLKGHTETVLSAIFSPDKKHIASASGDKTIRIWDIESGSVIKELTGHTGWINSLAFSPDGTHIVSASEDKTVRIWDVETGIMCRLLQGHNYSVRSVEYCPDRKTIVSNSYESLRFWDAESGAELKKIEGYFTNPIALSPNGKHIALYSRDGTIEIIDTEQGTSKVLSGHSLSVNSVKFSPDGKQFVSASNDKTIKLWDTESGTKIVSLEGHSSWVLSASFSPDGTRIVSGSYDKTVRIWDAKSGVELKVLKGHTDEVNSVAFSPDGKQVVSSSRDKTIRIWDVEPAEMDLTLRGHQEWVQSAVISPDEKFLASASWDKTIRIWDAISGTEIMELKGHTSFVNSANFSPDVKYIVSASTDNTIRIWDIETGKSIRELLGHTNSVYSASFSPDGKWIVSASEDGTVRIWDALTGTEIRKIATNYVKSALFSPDGKHIVTISSFEINIWDSKTGTKISDSEDCISHSIYTSSINLSHNEKHIVSGSINGTIHVFDMETRREKTMTGHNSRIESVAFSPDDKYVVSASTDNTIRIWDVESGIQLEVIVIKEDNFNRITAIFSPNGERVISASEDGTIHIWPFPPLQNLIDQTRERFKDRPLTAEERRMYYLE